MQCRRPRVRGEADPAEFLAANLTNEMGNPAKFTEYLNLAPRYGLKILPPSINDSEKHFNVVDGNIVYGLAGIKNVGENVVEEIIKERNAHGPYKDFMDFLSRQGEGINSKTVESLIKAGAFNELGIDRATLLANLEDALRFDKDTKEATAYGQLSLFGSDDPVVGEFKMRDAEPMQQMEVLQMEKDYLGFYISGHPLDAYSDQIAACVRADISDPDTIPVDQDTAVIALISSIKQVLTKAKKEKMAIITLQTKTGDIDAVAFPQTYEAIRDRIEEDQVYGFKGQFKRKNGEEKLSFAISEVVSPYELKPEAINMIHIQLGQRKTYAQDELRSLARILHDHEGYTPISFTIDGIDGEELRAGGVYSITYSDILRPELEEDPLVKKVWVS